MNQHLEASLALKVEATLGLTWVHIAVDGTQMAASSLLIPVLLQNEDLSRHVGL